MQQRCIRCWSCMKVSMPVGLCGEEIGFIGIIGIQVVY